MSAQALQRPRARPGTATLGAYSHDPTFYSDQKNDINLTSNAERVLLAVDNG